LIPDIIDPHRLTGYSSDLLSPRTGIIPVPVIHISIVDDDRVIVDITISVSVVMRISVVVDISLRYKYPVEIRNPYPNINIDIDTRAQWSPAIITATASPAHPCRSPAGIRNPDPSPAAAVIPASIMKWCPSPFVIRYPGISIFGHLPMSVTVIGSEIILINIRSPYVSVLRVIYPYTVWGEFLIKSFKRDIFILSLCLCR
jgi:hypothetical protein